MLRIAICEDDKDQQRIIENLIVNEEISESYELVKFDTGEDLVKAYKEENRFSIILLDMHMDKLDGIQTAEIIRKYDKDCIIIIITVILEYAVDGYSINAYDFILKPIDKMKFIKIFKNAVKKMQDENKIYVIQARGKTAALRLSDIKFIESNKKSVKIHCDKEIYSSNENISDGDKKLSEDGFIRISRYYLVNMKHIKEIRTNDILLTSGDMLNYSRKIRTEIKEKYMNFLMGVM